MPSCGGEQRKAGWDWFFFFVNLTPFERAGLSLVDTFSSPKTHETLNKISQLAMIFTA